MIKSALFIFIEAAKVYLSIAALNTIISQNTSLLMPRTGQDAGVIMLSIILCLLFAYSNNKDIIEEMHAEENKGRH